MSLIPMVMQTYNGADTIQCAVASIRAQSSSGRELIVDDDKSADDAASRRSRTGSEHPLPPSPFGGGMCAAHSHNVRRPSPTGRHLASLL